MSHSLTPVERSALYAAEERVEQGLKGAALALLEIKRKKLYREKYDTWEEYVQGRWGNDKAVRSIRRAIAHAKVLENVAETGPNGSALPNERQARELAGLEPETQSAVWQASGGRLSAAEIEEIRKKAEAALPQDQREAMVREAEKKAAAKARLRDVRTRGGEGWPETLHQIEALVIRVRKLTERKGPECDQALPFLDQFLTVVQSWDL